VGVSVALVRKRLEVDTLAEVLALGRVAVHVTVCVSILVDILELDTSLLHTVAGTVEVEAADSLGVLGDAESLGESGSNLGVNLVEDGKLLLEDVLRLAGRHVSSNVADHAVLSTWLGSVYLVPHLSWLDKVDWLDLGEVGDGIANELVVDLVQWNGSLHELGWCDRRDEVGSAALVVVGHLTVTLEATDLLGVQVLVDRELLVVGTDSVSVGVGVGEETGLEDRIGRRLNAWYEMGRVEGSLLDLGKVVGYVSVEGELSKLSERVVLVRPDLGQVKDVDLALLGLLGCHDLDVGLPLGEVSTLNSLKEILGGVVGSGSSELGGLLLSQELDTLLGQEMDLDVDPVTLLVDKLEGVARVSLHLSVPIWDSSISHQVHDLVYRLGVLGEVVPEVGRVLGTGKVGLRITLLGVDEVGELCGVAEEEDGGVVEDPVHVAIDSLHLDGETSGIAGSVCGSRLSTDSRESYGDGALHSLVLEDLGKADIFKRLCALEGTVGACTFGVHDTLWDTLSVKVGEEVYQVEVLEEEGTILSDALSLVRVGHGHTVGGGIGELGGLLILVVVVDLVV